MSGTIKTYYQLTKPGIIYGNTLNAIAGFLFASALVGHFNFWLLLASIGAIALIIASACVFNNYLDRNIDAKMARTKKRALVTGRVTKAAALLYASLLGVGGFTLLAFYTNLLTVFLGGLAIVMYVVVYGIAKRRSVYGTIVGSVSGSLPPVAAYTAVVGSLDTAACSLFLILTFWQMPHFYAIAIYRMKEYAAASIPVWSIKKGMQSTKIQIVLFIMGFIGANALLTLFGHTGIIYMVVMTLVGAFWLHRGFQGFNQADDVSWARKMFSLSLVVILTLDLMLAIGALLP